MATTETDYASLVPTADYYYYYYYCCCRASALREKPETNTIYAILLYNIIMCINDVFRHRRNKLKYYITRVFLHKIVITNI